MEYAVRWCAHRLPGLSEARADDYRNSINNHILPPGPNRPALATKRMADITVEDISLLMADKRHLSRSAQNKIVSTLTQMFASAYKDGVVSKNVCEGLKAGGRPPQKKIPLTANQKQRLIQAVRDTPAYPFVMLGPYAGLRREEILGLQWDCVHLSGTPNLEVERTVTFQRSNGAPLVKAEGKSEAARRKIPLPPPLLHCPQSLRIQNPYDYVIPSSTGGPKSRMGFRRLWGIVKTRTAGTRTEYDSHTKQKVTIERKVGDKIPNHPVQVTLDFHCTPHILRHTYITDLCKAGVNIKRIQYLAGHATIQMTLNVYAACMENQPDDLIDDVSNALT